MATTGTMAGPMAQPYPALPASPTLTNPDMILPDYDRASSPLDDDRSHSPLMMWKNSMAASSGPDLQQLYAAQGSQMPHAFPAAPMTPTTPIIYGNGTMLSDIGEVTEAESTPGKPSPTRRRLSPPRPTLKERESLVDAALRSSPTMGVESSIKIRAKQQASRERLRRASMDSTSTITTQDQANLFADFDDSVSVGDSVFQGDDEESVADSYVYDGSPVRPTHDETKLAVPDAGAGGSGGSSGNASGGEEPQSTASLSRRAEEILANAKKRLTTMEGNLSRARNALYVTSPSSLSFPSDGSTPSPPIQLRLAATPRDGPDTSSSIYSPGHARMGSDNALKIGLPVHVYPPRSASALGAAGGYRQPLTNSRSVDQIRDQLTGNHGRSQYKPRETSLEPLSEDDVLASPDLQPTNDRTSAQLDTFLSPTFGPEKSLTRSASAAQMRDLKDHMKDLKGKISSLREQARADSMKRRSLQSLRTPSPFTHARVDRWYGESADESPEKDNTGRNPWNGEVSSVDGDSPDTNRDAQDAPKARAVDGPAVEAQQVPTEAEQTFTESPVIPDAAVMASRIPREEMDDDLQTENGDAEEEEDGAAPPDAAYESESGESSYHDTLQHPLSHEDREDAFDYEHFILHSALGTISQRLARHGKRGSRGSFSSEDSVETTRGPTAESKTKDGEGSRSSLLRRSRRGSAASTSTVESFATATEGRASRANRSSSGSDDARPTPSEPLPSPQTPLTARRATFGADASSSYPPKRSSVEEPRQTQQPPVVRRPASSAATMLHRPSISSFESTGTNRSFPLVVAKKTPLHGIAAPNAAPPPAPSSDEELRSISETLMNETASLCEQQATADTPDDDAAAAAGRLSRLSMGENGPAAIQMLGKEDQFLVERLVATLGRCVLGLSDSGKASSESRMYRRRIDAARRILEGLDPA